MKPDDLRRELTTLEKLWRDGQKDEVARRIGEETGDSFRLLLGFLRLFALRRDEDSARRLCELVARVLGSRSHHPDPPCERCGKDPRPYRVVKDRLSSLDGDVLCDKCGAWIRSLNA